MGVLDKDAKRTTDEITKRDMDKNLGCFVKDWTKGRRFWTKPWTEKGTKEGEFLTSLHTRTRAIRMIQRKQKSSVEI